MDAFQKIGFIISYTDILLLYDAWGHEDVSESMFILREIAKNIPAICIVDNYDFKTYTLTGNSQQAHRTSVIFVQRQGIEHKSTVEKISHSGEKTKISKKLKEIAGELANVTQHIVSRDASSEPPVHKYTVPPIDGSLPQKKRSVIHALLRVNSNGD